MAFLAAILNQYVVPFVSPVAVQALDVEVAALVHPAASAYGPAELVERCTMYPVIADAPLPTGAAHDSVAVPFAGVATTAVGAPTAAVGVPDTGTE